MRADMMALIARLIKADQALLDTRHHISAAPRPAPMKNSRTFGEAPTFTGEHKDWPVGSFQFMAYMGSANHKSIVALHFAAMEQDTIRAASVRTRDFQAHNPQLYLAFALLCKVSVLVTVTEVNSGNEAWRGLHVTAITRIASEFGCRTCCH